MPLYRILQTLLSLRDVIQKDTELTSNELRTAMADRRLWRKNYVMSPN